MLAAQFIKTDDGQLYKKTAQGVLLRCIDKSTSEKVMEEVHDGECGPHMNAHMLAHKIMRLGYYWTTMKADCRKYVRHCHNCQIFANVQHVPPLMLYTMTSPWPFSTWGIDIIGKKLKIKHHKSSPYRPQTNGAVKAANKTVATILRKMTDNYREWPEKIPFALWRYMTSIRIATEATPYYLV
ncbi:uncharacterized protein LOC141595149 [Silene latifolia]|uniref:uncharacterized protein LOC141595149 n=1 Tax=Silene latifolia TaxID=37657 RepID=UPI003D76FF53